MNKRIFTTMLLIFILTACASKTATPTSQSAGSLSKQNQIIVGTLMLENTKYKITPEQAKELLPMWYVLKDLNSSDTAAQEEKDGLVNQIEEAMTKEQENAIIQMGLTRADMFTLMRGNSSGGASSAKTRTASGSSGNAGGPPDMGGGFPGMGGSSSSGTSSTNRSSSNKSSSASAAQLNNTPSALFDLVIEFLQKRITQ